MMKKIVMTIMMTAAVCLAQGPAQARQASRTNDGNYVRTYDCSQFSKISIGDVVAVPGANRHVNFRPLGDMTVRLVESDSYGIELSADQEEYADLFIADLNNDTLCIKVVQGNDIPNPKPKVTITVFMPSFEVLDLHGMIVTSEGTFRGKKVSVKMDGATSVSGLSIKADSADIDIDGYSDSSDFAITAKDGINLNFDGYIIMKELSLSATDIDIRGSNSVIEIHGADFRSKNLKLDCPTCFVLDHASATFDSGIFTSGYKSIEFDSISAGYIKANTVSASFKAAGTADSLDLTLQQSKVDMKDLKCKNVTINMSMSSASVYASDCLNYTLNDPICELDYYGNPNTVISKVPDVTEH